MICHKLGTGFWKRRSGVIVYHEQVMHTPTSGPAVAGNPTLLRGPTWARRILKKMAHSATLCEGQ